MKLLNRIRLADSNLYSSNSNRPPCLNLTNYNNIASLHHNNNNKVLGVPISGTEQYGTVPFREI